MSERRVLILNQQHMVAYSASHGSVYQEAEFSLDEQGQLDFQHWLKQRRSALIHLLADLPDEGFYQETLPYVTGADRAALLARKLNQHFFGTPYRLVSSLGREKEGRRDEQFLFAALTRPQAFETWLQLMHEAGVAVAGIHSPALLLPRLLDKQIDDAERLIILTLGSGGLRQSYFEQGQLRFSRLRPLTTDSIEEAAVNAYGEAVRIYQYLIGQRLLTRGQRVPVLCIASPDHFELLQRACVDTEELSFSFDSVQLAAKAKGLALLQSNSSIDALLVYTLIRQPPALQFGSTGARLDYIRWKRRSIINKSALAVLVLSALFVLFSAVSIWSDHEKADAASIAKQQAQQRYNAIVRSLPAIPITPMQLRSLIDQWQQLQSSSPTLAASLQPISVALQQYPQIELRALNWRLAASPDDSAPAAGADAWLIIDIEAQLPASSGLTRRAQSQHIDRFADALKQGPADNVRILQRPFDTDPHKALKGDNEIYAGKGAVTFSVRYWRKSDA